MKIKNKWKTMIAVVTAFFALSMTDKIDAVQQKTYLELFLGARKDKVDLNGTATSLLDPLLTEQRAYAKLKDLKVALIGLKGLVAIDNHWYVRGLFNYGRVHDGHATLLGLGNLATRQEVFGKVKGNTLDMDIAFGYGFCIHRSVNIAPVLGYAYNKQHVYTKHTHTEDGTRVPYHKVKTWWGGPFIGVDALWNPAPCWSVQATYEFHIAENRDKISTPLVDEDAFISLKSRGGTGHVCSLGASYYFSKCWYLGANLKGTSFKTRKSGLITPETDNINFADADFKEAKWTSGAVTLSIGRNF